MYFDDRYKPQWQMEYTGGGHYCLSKLVELQNIINVVEVGLNEGSVMLYKIPKEKLAEVKEKMEDSWDLWNIYEFEMIEAPQICEVDSSLTGYGGERRLTDDDDYSFLQDILSENEIKTLISILLDKKPWSEQKLNKYVSLLNSVV